jgi:hypothetical protein
VRLALVLALVACSKPAAPAKPAAEQLVDYLSTVAGADDVTRQREVASWQLERPLWDRTLIDPYKTLYADYTRAFPAMAPALVARLAKAGALTARQHYGGDPRLTNAQSRDRWSLPPQFPSLVAELDGAPIDVVFVRDGDHWRALAGLDTIVRGRVDALDHDCAERFILAGPIGRCSDVSWVIADSALRNQRERFDHACTLAKTLCGTGSP